MDFQKKENKDIKQKKKNNQKNEYLYFFIV